MERPAAFRFTQGLYYLALGTWFGALVMLAIAAAITFRTLEEHAFVLQTGLLHAAGVEPDHAADAPRIFAGEVVGQIIQGLTWLQAICALVAIACLLLQTTLFRRRLANAGRSRANLLRTLLVVGPALVLLLNVFWINPNVWQSREAMYDPARTETQRIEARLIFDHHHRLSERTTGGAALMLAVAVLISPFAFRVTPAPALIERPLPPDQRKNATDYE
ncbi:DUF4149 domain-containing protein [Phycisphaerales bacterium AB-hyl4]|uniref:DUF4149 domain-containing protein n=1 Tax=Natronomicrosphaera hydrolytica TaxID=3242702 RepID=A0ABV4U9W4_9BACT